MIDLFFIQNKYSGAKKYAEELISQNGLKSKKIKIYLISVAIGNITQIKTTVTEKYTSIDIPYLIDFGEENSPESRQYMEQCAPLLYPFMNPRHTTIIHTNHEMLVPIGITLKKKFPVKLVHTLHYLPEKKDFKSLINYYKKNIGQKIDKIITVTEYGKRSLTEYEFGLNPLNINCIYNGVEDEKTQINDDRKILRKKYGFSHSEKLILFVGRVEEHKGIFRLLQAFLELVNEKTKIRLMIVGTGDYGELFNQTKTNHGAITLFGKQNKKELNELYQIADIGVIPSKIEQCSYVALEMMSYGLPVVASDIDGLKELYVGESFARLVPVDPESGEINIDKLKDAIKELLITDNREIRRQARQKWRAHYQARHMAEATLKIYQQLSQEK